MEAWAREPAGDAHGDAHAASEALALGVRGYACEVFDDAVMAWRLHREDHLIHWQDDRALRVDRYDARNLLADRTAFRQLKARAGDAADGRGERSEEDALLDELRFGDLRRSTEQEPSEPTMGVAAGEERGADGITREAGKREEPFVRPADVPRSITVPLTLQQHRVMEAAARKTRGNAALEVMMKARLAADAAFGFLDERHALHSYYTFLRDRPSEGAVASTHSETKRPSTVRLLGDDYDDSEEERPREEALDARDSDADGGENAEEEAAMLVVNDADAAHRVGSDCDVSRRRRGSSRSRSRSRSRSHHRRRRCRSASRRRSRSQSREKSKHSSQSRERRRRSRSYRR